MVIHLLRCITRKEREEGTLPDPVWAEYFTFFTLRGKVTLVYEWENVIYQREDIVSFAIVDTPTIPFKKETINE